MNVELLKRTAAYMLAHPEGVDMHYWASGTFVADKQDGPPCGTTACIGGTAWALVNGACDEQWLIDNPDFDDYDDEAKAEYVCFAKPLGLDVAQSYRLFCLEDWPSAFRKSYEHATDAETRAQVVHDRIMHFIETGGAE